MHRIVTVAATLALLVAGLTPGLAATPDELIKELRGEAPAVERTPAQLEAAHKQVLEHLLPGMGAEKVPARQAPQQTYERLALRAARPGAEAERLAMCKAMAARLGPATPKHARVWLLRMLEYIGKAEAAEAGAGALGDADPLVRERARRALQNNPCPKVPGLLTAALAKATDPAWRVALINAIAYRPGDAGVNALLPHAAATDEDVRTAAVEALGRIGHESAVGAVAAATTKGSERARRIAMDNYLLLADKLAAKGDKAAALAIYRKLLARTGHVKCAAVIGLGRAGGVRELSTILKAMDDPNPKVRGAALGALELLPTKEVIAALQAHIAAAQPEVKVLLLGALAQRGDEASLPAFVAAAKDKDEDVRIAAYQGMVRIASDKAGLLLVKAMLEAKGKELAAITNAVVGIPGKGVTQALQEAISVGDASGRLAVVNCLIARRDPAVDTLMRATQDRDPKVREAAFKGIGTLGNASVIGRLLDLLIAAKDDRGRAAAERAVSAISARVEDEDERSAPAIAAFAKAAANVPARQALIRILGRNGGPKALAVIRAAAKDPDAQVRDAGIRALCNWAQPEVAPDLIAIAKTSPSQTHRVLALRGYVQAVSLIRDRPVDEMLKLYDDAITTARRPADKKMVLSGLSGIANLAALRMVERYRADPALRGEAVVAIVRIATAIAGAHPREARDALEQVPLLTEDKRLLKQAKDGLNLIERFDDYLVSWEVSGPYTDAKGKSHFDFAFPPEQALAKGVVWKIMKVGATRDKPWLLELDKALGGSNRAAYLRTRVYSPEMQPARMEVGSDDGVKVWIAGKLVHANNASRPCSPGQDKKTVTLSEGWNTVLMKVVQGSGEWAACLRFRGPDGAKLDGVRADIHGR